MNTKERFKEDAKEFTQKYVRMLDETDAIPILSKERAEQYRNALLETANFLSSGYNELSSKYGKETDPQIRKFLQYLDEVQEMAKQYAQKGNIFGISIVCTPRGSIEGEKIPLERMVESLG